MVRATARLGRTRVSAARVPHVLVACMPKSASSFLAAAIAGLPGMRQVSYSEGRDFREQELDLHRLCQYATIPSVSQQHVRYSSVTEELIRDFGITPVVLTRNLFDVVASMRDHVRGPESRGPAGYLTERHLALPDHELDVVIADIMMPWYFTFYLSWLECPEALRFTYEDVRSDPGRVLSRIAEVAEMDCSPDCIRGAVESALATAPRLNKGVSGRGESIAPEARERILHLAAHYPEKDFTVLGL